MKLKYIVIIIIVIVSTIACQRYDYKVYLDEELDNEGIEIWGYKIKYLSDCFEEAISYPDVSIKKVDKIETTEDITILGQFSIIGQRDDCYTDEIKVTMNNPIIIAHEFGHFLGKDDNYNDTNSIMYYKIKDYDRPLYTFKEFSGE